MKFLAFLFRILINRNLTSWVGSGHTDFQFLNNFKFQKTGIEKDVEPFCNEAILSMDLRLAKVVNCSYMEVLRTISAYCDAKNLSFMIIGGHAINAYGIYRNTADIDLVVRAKDKIEWLAILKLLKYDKAQDDARFARFNAHSLANWPIDLMFVDEATFLKLSEQSVVKSFGEAEVRVVSARHLATMKIHALKHFQAHRFSKDFSDLISLLRSGQTGLTDEELKDLCIQYAELELYNKLKKDWHGS